MPKANRIGKDKKKSKVKSVVVKVNNSQANMAGAANVNSNHSTDQNHQTNKRYTKKLGQGIAKYRTDNTIKRLKRGNPDKIDENEETIPDARVNLNQSMLEDNYPMDEQRAQFIEDGEEIEMEINDGGAKAREFASETEHESNDNDLESDVNIDNGLEQGEIIDDSDELEVCQTQETTRKVTKSPKDRRTGQNCQSVEECLDTLSNALLEMKDMFFKSNNNIDERRKTENGPSTSKDQLKMKKRQGNLSSGSVLTDTTIYQNALNQNEEEQRTIDGDPEISFKIKSVKTIQGQSDQFDQEGQKRWGSSSSKDQVNTSEELMEIDMDMIVSLQIVQLRQQGEVTWLMKMKDGIGERLWDVKLTKLFEKQKLPRQRFSGLQVIILKIICNKTMKEW